MSEWEALTAKWKGSHGNGNGHGPSLAIEVRKLLSATLLPTPTAGDAASARNSTATRHRNPPTGVHAGDTLTDVLVPVTLLPTPAARDHKGKSLENREGGNALPDVTDWGKYAPAIERWVEVMDRPAPDPTDGQGRLNPALVEWMMGYPEGWVDGISRTGQLKALGNAIVPHQAAAAWGHLLGLDTDRQAGRQAGSLLPTPTTHTFAHLPTPRTSDANGAGSHGNGGLDLRTTCQLLRHGSDAMEDL